MKELYRITLPYACAGIVVENDTIYDAAPIFRWMIRKNIDYVKTWVNKKQGNIIRVNTKE